MHKLQFISVVLNEDYTCNTHLDPLIELGGNSRCNIIFGDNQDDKSVDVTDKGCDILLLCKVSV